MLSPTLQLLKGDHSPARQQPRQGKRNINFDKLVRRTFIEAEERESRKRASRLVRLNFLCAESSKRLDLVKSQVMKEGDLMRSPANVQPSLERPSHNSARNLLGLSADANPRSQTQINLPTNDTPVDYVSQNMFQIFRGDQQHALRLRHNHSNFTQPAPSRLDRVQSAANCGSSSAKN